MALILTSGPAVLPLTLAEAKDHLRVAHSDEDTLITRLIETATQHVDGLDGILGRACITQTWTLTLDAFPSVIILPLPPCQSVAAITYIDTNGASQTLAVSRYQVTGIGGEGRVHP
ncbi:MAG: head-tail connector protein, partial [Pseudomonadota bacterium]